MKNWLWKNRTRMERNDMVEYLYGLLIDKVGRDEGWSGG